MAVKLTPQMVLAGRAVIEANALQFYESAKDDAAWLWFLGLIYNSMRQYEPPAAPAAPPKVPAAHHEEHHTEHAEHHPELHPRPPKAGK